MKTIAGRLDRFEQTLDMRLRALMRSDEQLERDYEGMRRVLEYIGLPVLPKNVQVRQWQDSEKRRAEIMLATGCTKEASAVKQLVETFARYEETEESARAYLLEINEVHPAVERDLRAGVPGEQSEAGKRLAALLLRTGLSKTE
jgi:hypothetical protein